MIGLARDHFDHEKPGFMARPPKGRQLNPPIFCIIEAKSVHVGIIAGQLGPDERARFAHEGRNPRHVMRGFFRQSSYRRTALLDGRPIAIWGVTGTLCSSEGILWLRLTTAARKMPRLVVEESRKELARMLETRQRLVIYIAEHDRLALRFAGFLGFEFAAPTMIEGVNFMAHRGALEHAGLRDF